ncbi:hypothetical protein Sango_2343700 [Sesamum angolense]|uniref:Uncharacterized protein n=1 Tax=Sesamum angolense TaxID=2727404 RepID=A0AAE1W5X1_9LAMI|nr:hypothetical protein Sango_2343700 [Sesamum angolense]
MKQEIKMSISEDEKLSQMIKDYMELGSTITDSCFFQPPSQLPLQLVHHHPIYFSLQEIMEETPEAEAEVYGKILFYLKDMEYYSKDKAMSKLKKHWILLRLQMDNYEAHLCKTSWSTPFATPSVFQFKGDYEYVDVMMRSGCKEVMRVIVDIDFRTQFEVARPTPDYQQLTNAIPMVFVGTEEKLERSISFICSAAKHSLREGDCTFLHGERPVTCTPNGSLPTAKGFLCRNSTSQHISPKLEMPVFLIFFNFTNCPHTFNSSSSSR